MRAGKFARARSHEQQRPVRRASCAYCANGQDGGGVYTSSDPHPPPQQVCLNFLVDMWSEADVETATTAASATPTAADVGPLVMGPVAALLLGRCRGRMRLFLPLRC